MSMRVLEETSKESRTSLEVALGLHPGDALITAIHVLIASLDSQRIQLAGLHHHIQGVSHLNLETHRIRIAPTSYPSIVDEEK